MQKLWMQELTVSLQMTKAPGDVPDAGSLYNTPPAVVATCEEFRNNQRAFCRLSVKPCISTAWWGCHQLLQEHMERGCSGITLPFQRAEWPRRMVTLKAMSHRYKRLSVKQVASWHTYTNSNICCQILHACILSLSCFLQQKWEILWGQPWFIFWVSLGFSLWSRILTENSFMLVSEVISFPHISFKSFNMLLISRHREWLFWAIKGWQSLCMLLWYNTRSDFDILEAICTAAFTFPTSDFAFSNYSNHCKLNALSTAFWALIMSVCS